MNVPAHTHVDEHNCAFPSFDPDDYEVLIGGSSFGQCNTQGSGTNYYTNYNHNTAFSNGGMIDPYAYDPNNPIRYLFYTSNQIANHFPSNDASGNNNLFNSSYPGLQEKLNSLGSPPGSVNIIQIADVSMNYAIRATAGLLFWFAKEADLMKSITINTNYPDIFVQMRNPARSISPSSQYSWLPQIPYTLKFENNITIDLMADPWAHGYQFSRWEKRDKGNHILNFYPTLEWLSTSANATSNFIAMYNPLVSLSFSPIIYDGQAGTFYYQNLTTGEISSTFQILANSPASIKAVGPQGYSFISWSDGHTENPRSFIIPTSQSGIYATFKATHFSNNTTALANSSQKKTMRSDDGNLHLVYSSMGHVWYEISSNNGATWQLANNGKPLDTYGGKNSSIDYSPSEGGGGNNIVITFQSDNNGDAELTTQFFQNGVLQFQDSFIPNPINDYSNYDLTPVISDGVNGRVIVVWRNSGLYYRLGQVLITDHQFQWYNAGIAVPNTNNNSRVAAITCKKGNSTFHLAWEQSYAEIRYSKLTLITNQTAIQFSDYAAISTGGGFPTVYDPSIAVNGSDYPSVVWIGSPYYNSSTKRVIQRSKSVSGWSSTFYQYDDKAFFPVVNNTDDGANIIPAWSYDNGSTTKFVRGGVIKSFNTQGRYIQLANGPNLNSMYGSAFRNTSVPYYFTTTPSVGSVAKDNSNINAGRAIIVTKDKAIFYYTLGDLTLDGKAVAFINVEDDFIIKNREDAIQCLISEPVNVNNLSELTFNMETGISDSLYSKNLFVEDKFLGFKVEIIDEKEGKILGTYNDISSDKNSLLSNRNNSYKIDLTGIKDKTVRFRIIVEDNLEGLYTIANILDDGNVLPKTGEENVTLDQEIAVTEYALAQNYPNPFNPRTTIAYQLPEDGLVTLRIFDVLGNEVTTLVNEYKTSGRYNVNFDASSLASGVYLYQMKVNSYTATRKLLLMK
jgi:hypothetical protein